MLCGVCTKEVENSATILLKNYQTNKTRERKIGLSFLLSFPEYLVLSTVNTHSRVLCKGSNCEPKKDPVHHVEQLRKGTPSAEDVC